VRSEFYNGDITQAELRLRWQWDKLRGDPRFQKLLDAPLHTPGPTAGGPSYNETGVPIGAFNPFNPFQQIISGGTRARLVDFGNRNVDNETDAYFSTIGLKGDKLFDGSWGYAAFFRYSQIKNTATGNRVSSSRFDRILNAADPIFDPASTQYIGSTVPYNPFDDFRRPIATNSLPVAFATVHPMEIDLSKLATLDLNIYTTSLFKLPAGGFGLAFGGQFRRETLTQEPDRATFLGRGPLSSQTRAGRLMRFTPKDTSPFLAQLLRRLVSMPWSLQPHSALKNS
jgi:hypothetical protein